MSWAGTTAGRYERPCDTNEIFLRALFDATAPINRAHWTVNTVVKISTEIPDLEKELPRAWLRTRWQAPFLAALIKDTKLVYEVPDHAAQVEWLAQTFFVEKGEVDDFLLHIRPQEYSSLHYFPDCHQIVLRLHHWLADGLGSLSVMNILLQSLARAELAGKSSLCFCVKYLENA